MKTYRCVKRVGSPGVSLVEVMICAVIIAVMLYALTGTSKMGKVSSETVNQVADEINDQRDTVRIVRDDFQSTNDTMITVETLPDDNHQATFMLPIEDLDGSMTWGVFDKSLGPTWQAQTKPDWSIRYTVKMASVNGELIPVLMRQILDTELAVQKEEIVAERVKSESGAPAGFSVVQNGDMWEIKISTYGEGGSCTDGQETIFQVLARN